MRALRSPWPRRAGAWAGALACVWACGKANPGDATSAVDTAAASADDAATLGAVDATPETPANPCPGGPDCPCQGHGECATGLCIATPVGSRCAKPCSGGCPLGFVCATVGTAGQDAVPLCLPRWQRLCEPCTNSASCVTLGDPGGRCVRYLDGVRLDGAFCGTACESGDACPPGYTCRDATTVDGQATRQCVRATGTTAKLDACPCSARAADLQLATPCAGDAGCTGTRTCLTAGPQGLSPCNAPLPATETCDGADQDCDGLTDEATCDDANPCTTDLCPAAGQGKIQCLHAPADGQPCDDASPCTVNDLCLSGACAGGQQTCQCTADADCQVFDDGNFCNGVLRCAKGKLPWTCAVDLATVVTCTGSAPVCQQFACQAATGKCAAVPVADGSACSDGAVCTQGDACLGGSCLPGTPICQCQQDADCAAFEDGDACNGTLRCDTQALPHTCKTDPKTVVTCAAKTSDPCLTTACLPKSGACAVVPQAKGAPCDDGVACTVGDACLAGSCQPGQDVCQCQDDAGCAAFDDANACNGALYCDNTALPWVCKLNPASVVACSAKNDSPCATNTCQPNSGKCLVVPVNEGGPCDADGQPCTAGDQCLGGQCTAGPNVCDCETDAGCAGKDDGDLCNGTLYCELAAGKCTINPATVVTCPAGSSNPCQELACNPATGACEVKLAADQTPCDDGNPCTAGDACKAGTCTGAAEVCACQADADCLAKDDGNLCNGVLYCDKAAGTCAANLASVVTCATGDDTDCLKSVCNPKTGKCEGKPLLTATPCSDGNACTTGDACAGGICQPGANACICSQTSDCKAKEDGDLCNGVLYCDKASGACLVNPASVVTCPTAGDSSCLAMACQPASGTCKLQPRNQGLPCDDGDPCTGGDHCDLGTCKPTAAVCACKADADCQGKGPKNPCLGKTYCDKTQAPFVCALLPGSAVPCSGKPTGACTAIQCDPTSGKCASLPVLWGTPCADGQTCTQGDACLGGSCVPGKNVCPCATAADCKDGVACSLDLCQPAVGCSHAASATACDDGNTCTADACDLALGCTQAAVPGQCSDGDACSTPDTCTAGACVSGSAVTCGDDGNPCTVEACDPAGGCTVTVGAFACDDGNPCSQADVCAAAKCQPGPPKDCTDADPCSLDACVPGKGCVHTAKPCDDANACTQDGCQAGKGCVALPVAATCDDGNPCTQGDACKAGVCAAGTAVAGCQAPVCGPGGAVLFSTVTSLAGPFPRGVAPRKDGGLWVALQHAAGNQYIGLLRMGANGQVVSSAGYGAKPAYEGTGVVALADGSALVMGRWYPSGAKPEAVVVRVLDDGKATWALDLPGLASATSREIIAGTAAQGGAVLLGYGSEKSGATRIGSDGAVAWSVSVPGNFKAVAAATDGGFIVAGTILVRLKATGEATWANAVPLGEWTYDVPQWVVAATDGGAVTLDTSPRLMRFNAGGVLLWQRKGLVPWSVRGLGVGEGGQVVLFGESVAQQGWPQWHVARAFASGALAWSASAPWTSPTAGNTQVNAAAALPDGGFAVAGLWNHYPAYNVMVARIGVWGHASCQTAGPCATLTPADCSDGSLCTVEHCLAAKGCLNLATTSPCDDGSPCTDDACAPATGCAYAPKPNGLACNDGSPCTQGDQCAAGLCTGGPVACDDLEPCTTDTCDGGKGCVHTPIAAGPCDDLEPCTLGETCVAGKCTPAFTLPDGVTCSGG